MLFSAVQEERILRYDPATGKADVFRKYTGRTNGLALPQDGTVFGAQEGGRRVVHFLKDGSTAPTHDLLDGKHHNQPTDVIVDSKGRVWIADAYNAQPPYGPPVYPVSRPRLGAAARARRAPAGGSKRVTHDTMGPRAVLLSPDEKTLYVADGDAERGDVLPAVRLSGEARTASVGPGKVLIDVRSRRSAASRACASTARATSSRAPAGRRAGVGPDALRDLAVRHDARDRTRRRRTCRCACAFGDAGLASLYLTAGDGGLYRAKNTGRRGLQR